MRQEITSDNCYRLTGIDYIDLLALTGIFGIHSKAEFIELVEKEKIIYTAYQEDGITKVGFITPIIEELWIEIVSEEEIYNALFKLLVKGKNYGFRRLLEEVKNARKLGFERITLWAYGSYDELTYWDGYIVWGKYGFLMYKPDEIADFDQLMISVGRPECKDINDLVSTDNGTNLWKQLGKAWYGKFDLHVPSRSNDICEAYRLKKGL